jgi:hypothetical protein
LFPRLDIATLPASRDWSFAAVQVYPEMVPKYELPWILKIPYNLGLRHTS